MRVCKKMVVGVLAFSFVLAGFPPMGAEAKSISENKAAIELPTKYDLRDDGYVTPVKLQNPFSTCWAFGAIAAAESSILSSSGLTYAETVDEYGYGFDLSEKHLAWYASLPISKYDDPKQVGEGIYRKNDDPNTPYSSGGYSTQVTSLFSAGTGPVKESNVPYCGKTGLTQYDVLSSMTEEEKTEYLTEKYMPSAIEQGKTLEQYCMSRVEGLGLNKGLSDYDPVKLFFEWSFDKIYKESKENTVFSEKDDWTLPEYYTDSDGNKYSYRNVYDGYTLKNGNLLPELCLYDYDISVASSKNRYGRIWKGINPEGTRAVKQELINGRGVKIMFHADKALPEQEGTGKFINENTWSQYTYEMQDPNHTVCIIGWDDTYSASNFNSGHRPPGDGAWLVKNSWGSETDCVPLENGSMLNKNDWGIVDKDGKHTGYFWLSYYDKSMGCSETFEFSKIYNNQAFYVLGYDYMPSTGDLYYKSSDVLESANVFTIKKDEADLRISSISTKTADINSRVKLSVYKLKKGWKTPTDGTLLYQTSQNFEYAGYHRIEIPKGEQFVVKRGETIAVVNTNTSIDNDGKKEYSFAVNSGYSKAYADENGYDEYLKGVINKGESFLYYEGEWEDFVKTYESIQNSGSEIDNFSIKVFGTEVPEDEQVITAKNKSVTLKAKVKKNKTTAVSKKVSFTGGVKTSGNGALTYKKISGAKNIVVTRAGKVYAKKGTKTGTYKLMVQISASKTKEYRASDAYMNLTVKVKKSK
ncbi:MAG: C1 family peptidase [Eubacterium sp.]|nr:C1 family peptidase [Eubacterium sp.]